MQEKGRENASSLSICPALLMESKGRWMEAFWEREHEMRCGSRAGGAPGQTKVGDLEGAVLRALAHDQDVGRLQVAVQHPVLVHCVHALQQLPDQRPAARPEQLKSHRCEPLQAIPYISCGGLGRRTVMYACRCEALVHRGRL